MGLINIVVDSDSPEDVFHAALSLAQKLSEHPQECMRGDRMSVMSLPLDHGSKKGAGRWNVQGEERRAMALEFQHGRNSLGYLGEALEAFVNRGKDAPKL